MTHNDYVVLAALALMLISIIINITTTTEEK